MKGANAPVPSGTQHVVYADDTDIKVFPAGVGGDGASPLRDIKVPAPIVQVVAVADGADGTIYVLGATSTANGAPRVLDAIPPGSSAPSWSIPIVNGIALADVGDGIDVLSLVSSATPQNQNLVAAVTTYSYAGVPKRSFTLQGPFDYASGLAADPSGNVYVSFASFSDNGNVREFAAGATGTPAPIASIDTPQSAGLFYAVTIGPGNEILVLDNDVVADGGGLVKSLNRDGSFGRTAAAVRAFTQSAGVAADAKGNVYTPDTKLGGYFGQLFRDEQPDEIDIFGPGTDLRNCASLEPTTRITHAANDPNATIRAISVGG